MVCAAKFVRSTLQGWVDPRYLLVRVDRTTSHYQIIKPDLIGSRVAGIQD